MFLEFFHRGDYSTKSTSNHYYDKITTIFIIKRVICETITTVECTEHPGLGKK